jgi:hypothetical protein
VEAKHCGSDGNRRSEQRSAVDGVSVGVFFFFFGQCVFLVSNIYTNGMVQNSTDLKVWFFFLYFQSYFFSYFQSYFFSYFF